MLLRNRADVRTLIWVVLAPALVALQLVVPSLAPWLFWLSAYFALACGVIAHNHNHCPTFTGRRANTVFSAWISVFYGYPTFAWIPTHNQNHHRYLNRKGDATITWRYTNRHTALVALTYFFVSAYWQGEPIRAYIRAAREKNPTRFRAIVTQYVVVFGTHAALLALAVWLHGPALGLRTWALACLIPALFALWTIMFFNYEQHVHTDPWSTHDHSRSWEGRLVNFLLFNNGLHAAHHEHPGTHWSELRAIHQELRAKIDPRLLNGGLAPYLIRQYVLAPVWPRFGTSQLGRAPFDVPTVLARNAAAPAAPAILADGGDERAFE